MALGMADPLERMDVSRLRGGGGEERPKVEFLVISASLSRHSSSHLHNPSPWLHQWPSIHFWKGQKAKQDGQNTSHQAQV
jgi:hypothetical protein